MKMEGLELAKACAQIAEEVQAENVRVLDLRGLSSLTDFMVICTGLSQPHLKAVLRDIGNDLLEKHDVKAHETEGAPSSKWVVLDFIDVMVHVMDEEMRYLYNLETLWDDAKEVDWSTS